MDWESDHCIYCFSNSKSEENLGLEKLEVGEIRDHRISKWENPKSGENSLLEKLDIREIWGHGELMKFTNTDVYVI